MARAPDPRAIDNGVDGHPRLRDRAGLLLLAGLALALSVQSAAARLLARHAPDAALSISPGDAIALGVKATETMATGLRDHAQLTVAREEAQRSLGRDLTRDDALFVLAATQTDAAPKGRAAALVRQAETLSRRNLPAQLWLIEDAVGRGSVLGALRHFDIALRTSEVAGPVLFPVLRTALEDAGLTRPITRTVDAAPWRDAFLQYAVSLNRPTPALAAVVGGQHGLLPYQGTDLRAALVTQLAAAKSYDAAAQLALDMPAGSVRDVDFADEGGYPPFAWQLTDESGLSARRLREGSTSMLEVEADDGAAGRVATQMIRLAAGSYVLSARALTDEPGLSARLTCAGDGRELVRMPLTQSRAVAVDVPAGCAYQTLDILVSAGDRASGRGEWRLGRIDLIQTENAGVR